MFLLIICQKMASIVFSAKRTHPRLATLFRFHDFELIFSIFLHRQEPIYYIFINYLPKNGKHRFSVFSINQLLGNLCFYIQL
jgi:hypothetical protein